MGLTNTGMAQMAKLMGTNTNDAVTFGYIGIGTSATAFDASQTNLQSPNQRAVSTSQTVTTDTLTTVTQFSFGGSYNINELGLFTAGSGGIMLCRTVLGSPISVTANDKIRATLNFQITASPAYYVSKTGSSDTYDGLSPTWSSGLHGPWATIQHAVDIAVAGDVIYLRGGIYNEAVRMVRSGTAGHPITLTNYNGEVAIIDGTGAPCPDWGGLINLWNVAGTVGYSYFTISNLTIQNSDGVGIRASGFTVAAPNHDIIIDHCNFYNIAENALLFWEDEVPTNGHIENIVVTNCIFDNIQTSVTAGESVTFVGCKNVLIQNNTLTRCHTTCMDICTNSEDVTIDNNDFETSYVRDFSSGLYLDGSQKSGGASITNVVISNNYFHGQITGIKLCCEVGSTLSSLNNITIVNNVFNIDAKTRPTDGAIMINTNDGTAQWYANDLTIKHNTIYVSAGDWTWDACVHSDLTEAYIHNIIIANNILMSGSGTYPSYQLKFKVTKAEADLIRANNLYYKVGGTASCYFTDDTGNDCLEASALEGNPLFVSLGTDFHLTTSSPAKNTGTVTYTWPTDFDGITRDASPDIGAYEYH